MRTNKFLVIALAAAGLFTACSNNDEPVKMNQGNEISFRLQGGMPSAKTTATTIDNVDAFVVWGSDNTPTPLLFDGVTVARKAETTPAVFTYAPNRYYGQGATAAAYIAYSPVSAGVVSGITLNGVLVDPSTFTYKVLAPENTLGVTTQEDLLFTAAGVSTSATVVPLSFIHALSRVFITATNSTSDLITIESLTLSGLKSEGTITVNAGATGWDWGGQTDITPYEYALAPTGVAVPVGSAKTMVTSMEQGMMILPQTTPPAADLEEVSLDVVYGIGNLTGQTKKIVIPSYKFAANNQYSIDIAFTDVAITFTITVTAFDTPIKEVNP